MKKQFFVVRENQMGDLTISAFSELMAAMKKYDSIKLDVFDSSKYLLDGEEGRDVSKCKMSRVSEPFFGAVCLNSETYERKKVKAA